MISQPDKRNNGTVKKREFLDALAENGSIRHAAVLAGIGRTTAYRWKSEDEEFAAAWDESVEDSTCKLEESMFLRALDKDTTAAIFLLKARRPATYRERHEVITKDEDLDRAIEYEVDRIVKERQNTLAAPAPGNGNGNGH